MAGVTKVTFTCEENQHLQELHQAGMVSSSDGLCGALIDRAVQATGHPREVLKRKIHNMNRAVRGKRPKRSGRMPVIRGTSAYNLYVQEKQSGGGGQFRKWASSWAVEAPSVKAHFRKRAQEVRSREDSELSLVEKKALTKTLMDQMRKMIQRLEGLGVESFMIAKSEAESFEMGSNGGMAFLAEQDTNVATQFYATTGSSIVVPSLKSKGGKKMQEKAVKDLLNQKFRAFVGKSVPFPYGSYTKGTAAFQVCGLPEGVQLKKLSNMSRLSLQQILAGADKISIIARVAQSAAPAQEGPIPDVTLQDDPNVAIEEEQLSLVLEEEELTTVEFIYPTNGRTQDGGRPRVLGRRVERDGSLHFQVTQSDGETCWIEEDDLPVSVIAEGL